MFSALFALVHSLPVEKEPGNGSLKHASELSSSTDNKKSTIFHVEEKTPESGSVVVELIYNGNNENPIPSKAADKDKYVIDPQINEVSDSKTVLNRSKTSITNGNTEKKNSVQATELSKAVKSSEANENTEIKSSTSEENLPKSSKEQNYFYDAYYPVPPFPEQDTRFNPLNPLSIYDREFREPVFASHFERQMYIWTNIYIYMWRVDENKVV